MVYCLDPKVTGNDRYLCFNLEGQCRLEVSPPEGFWVVGCRKSDLSLDCLSDLCNFFLKISPPKKYLQCLEVVNASSPFPWSYLMTEKDYRDYIQGVSDAARQALETCDTCYYKMVHRPSRSLLKSLDRAFIDQKFLSKVLKNPDLTEGQRSLLETFSPGSDGFAKKVKYNQFSSRTGRLVVEDGPRILTLRKDLRKVIRSRYDNGIIFQLDFKCLEARVALSSVGKQSEKDVYAQIENEVLDGSHSRDVSKVATLSALYGIGRRELSKRLKISFEVAGEILQKIHHHFEVAKVTERLVKESRELGHITNFFGRKLKSLESAPHVLYNNYVQSSGVDVSLLGFEKILRSVSGFKIHPIFVIHDALLVDCHPDCVKSLYDFAREGEEIPGIPGRFHLEIERIT